MRYITGKKFETTFLRIFLINFFLSFFFFSKSNISDYDHNLNFLHVDFPALN